MCQRVYTCLLAVMMAFPPILWGDFFIVIIANALWHLPAPWPKQSTSTSLYIEKTHILIPLSQLRPLDCLNIPASLETCSMDLAEFQVLDTKWVHMCEYSLDFILANLELFRIRTEALPFILSLCLADELSYQVNLSWSLSGIAGSLKVSYLNMTIYR